MSVTATSAHAGLTRAGRARRATRCRATRSGRVARCTSTSALRASPRRLSTCGGSSREWAEKTVGYSWPLAWQARGWLDRVFGGVGLRRGRRDPARLRSGDAVDFWRVEEIDPGHLLRLRAEMRLPGRAWLELRVDTASEGSTYTQRAVFQPRGLA